MRMFNISFFIGNSINNIYNINNLRKKFETSINIIITLSFLGFFLFFNLGSIKKNINNPFLYLQKELNTKKMSINKPKHLFNYKGETENDINNKTLRELTTYFQGNYNKQDFLRRKQIKNIIDKLTNKKYIGKWFTEEEEEKKLLIGNSIEGITKLKFNRATEISTHQDALAILISNFEDKYINHWLHHTSFILNKNLFFETDKINNKFYFKGKWETEVDYGEIFITKISRRYPCSSNLSIVFPLRNVTFSTNTSNGESFVETIDTIDNSNFTISFNSSCGFNMTMEMHLEEKNREKETKREIDKYVILILTINFIYMLSIYIMNKDLKNNNDAIKCISIFTIIQNINWHIYCCMTHIAWSVTNSKFFFHFSFIVLIYFINIICFDFRFTINYWNVKKDCINNRSLINLKIIFYFSFYLFFFMSFFLISDLMIFYPLIFICNFIIWTPQIIYNAIYYNKYNYPFFYILSSTIDRLFFGIYFRAYDGNFYKIKGNKVFIFIIIIYLIINIIIMVLQSLKGPRFFMKKKYQKEEFDFYKTKEELLEYSNDFSNIECVICLSPIFNEENPVEIKNENDKEEDNNNNSIVNSSRNGIDISINELNKDNKNKNLEINILKQKDIKKDKVINEKKINKNAFILVEIFDILFLKGFYQFYKISKNAQNKKYMRTPCNHYFHAICLEKWFLRKKECPNCRTNLEDKIL